MDGEQVDDAEVEEELPTLRETEVKPLHKALLTVTANLSKLAYVKMRGKAVVYMTIRCAVTVSQQGLDA